MSANYNSVDDEETGEGGYREGGDRENTIVRLPRVAFPLARPFFLP